MWRGALERTVMEGFSLKVVGEGEGVFVCGWTYICGAEHPFALSAELNGYTREGIGRLGGDGCIGHGEKAGLLIIQCWNLMLEWLIDE